THENLGATRPRAFTKGKVAPERLAEHVRPVHRLDRRVGLLPLRVLDQDITLHEARPPIEIDVDVPHVAVLAERVQDVLLLRLLVDVPHEDDPALDALDRARAGGSCAVEGAPAQLGVVAVRAVAVAAALRPQARAALAAGGRRDVDLERGHGFLQEAAAAWVC
ncbi:unnamed protein product, partial [Pelagomonas calceolata]